LGITPISSARHRFPPDVIRHAIWLYLRFTLSCRDVKELLLERDHRCVSQGTPQLICTRSKFTVTLPEK
jgi:transposase-like protein